MIYVITVATHNEAYFDALVKSCKNNNIDLIILGFNEKWQGFSWRFNLINNYIKKLKDDDIVLFVDAFDVIIVDKIEEIERRFKEFNKPIVISHENSITIELLLYYLLYGYTEHTINAGTYIGYVYALKKLFNIVKEKYKNYSEEEFNKLDDQKILATICKNNKNFTNKYIAFDKKLYIFNTIPFKNNFEIINHFLNNTYNIKDNFDIKDNKLILKNKKYNSCIYHASGNKNINSLAFYYDLPYTNKRDKYYTNNIYNYINNIYNYIRKIYNNNIMN